MNDNQDTPIQVRYYNYISGQWDLIEKPLKDFDYATAIQYVHKNDLKRFDSLCKNGYEPGIAMLTTMAEQAGKRS